MSVVFLFPLFGLLATAGIIFLPRRAARNNRTRLDGEIRSTAERKIFPDHPRWPDGIVRIVTAVEFCSKIIPGRLHG